MQSARARALVCVYVCVCASVRALSGLHMMHTTRVQRVCWPAVPQERCCQQRRATLITIHNETRHLPLSKLLLRSAALNVLPTRAQTQFNIGQSS